ncbi:MAG TPA: FHA domain-containing protein [Gemmatimonadaceae bacterium]|nr:FHA domain-containing protein [Gemmatimonadaceae bacterium]
MLVLAALVLLGATALVVMRVRREERRETDRSALPQLVYFPPPSEITVTPRPARHWEPPPPAAPVTPPPAPSPPTTPASAAATASSDSDTPVEHPGARAAAPGTLAMLPGRLEVVAGEARGHDIRFVRTSTNGEQQVTIGRGEGPPYEHVQLRAPTVSRRHARLCYREGLWSITNLSSTNPLLVNGVPLTPGGSARELDDGDMIEMGEVVFRFRDH